MRSLSRFFLPLALVLLTSADSHWLMAQATPSRVVRRVPPGAVPNGQPGKPGAASPTPGKPGDKSKPDDKKDDKKPSGGDASTVKRPDKPKFEPKPEDLKLVSLGDDEVRFNFRGAPWLTVLQQLAEKSSYNLDWQELPGDHLNLVTRRSYKLDEARDLINRHLLARGYTMILHDEVLTVISLKDIKNVNPAVVPEVAPEDLDKHMPHEYVRTSFLLETLLAMELEGQLAPLISPQHGRLKAVESLNRIEAMDTVANLQQIQKLLMSEDSTQGQQRLMREFILEHTRAAETLIYLQDLLGIERPPAGGAGAGGNSSQQMRQMQQQMQQQMRQMQQNKGKAGGGKEPEKVRLVVNTRRNSILATAPFDKMAIIAQAVSTIDVPPDPSESLFHNIDRMQTYRLAGTDPETFVKTLEQLGGLDLDTRLEVDKENKAVIAYASKVDHLMISRLKKKLDGSGRKFEVIPLRRYEADYVAGTIKAMMVGEEEKQNSRSRYSWYGYGYGRSNESNEKPDQFRVEGDVENNRLLVWANEVELEEVESLLIKLGEIRVRGSNPSRMRVLESVSPEDAEELLRRLEKIWPGIRPNELILPPEEKRPETEEKQETDPSLDDSPGKSASVDKRSAVVLANFFEGEASPEVPAEETAPSVEQAQRPRQAAAPTTRDEVPPITITRGFNGKLIIKCDDPAALDVLEELMAEIAPPQKDYQIFYLKHATAFYVVENLEAYFKEDEEENKGRRPYWYYWDYGRDDNKKEAPRLSKRKPIKFIEDYDTNSIMVRGGDASQWKTVEDLIKIYDTPPPQLANNVRLIKAVKLKYAQAKDVETTIKDVFRDLLSANDKALQDQNKAQKNSRYTINYGGSDDDDSVKQSRFKGALSLGVYPDTNTIIISAKKNILELVGEMIVNLDEDAKPLETNLNVVKLQPGMNSQLFQERLSKLLAKPKPPKEDKKKEQPQQEQKQDSPVEVF